VDTCRQSVGKLHKFVVRYLSAFAKRISLAYLSRPIVSKRLIPFCAGSIDFSIQVISKVISCLWLHKVSLSAQSAKKGVPPSNFCPTKPHRTPTPTCARWDSGAATHTVLLKRLSSYKIPRSMKEAREIHAFAV
jgi:hypothetical protein